MKLCIFKQLPFLRISCRPGANRFLRFFIYKFLHDERTDEGFILIVVVVVVVEVLISCCCEERLPEIMALL